MRRRSTSASKSFASASALSVEEFRARIDALLQEAATELERTRAVSDAIRCRA